MKRDWNKPPYTSAALKEKLGDFRAPQGLYEKTKQMPCLGQGGRRLVQGDLQVLLRLGAVPDERPQRRELRFGGIPRRRPGRGTKSCHRAIAQSALRPEGARAAVPEG